MIGMTMWPVIGLDAVGAMLRGSGRETRMKAMAVQPFIPMFIFYP